MSQAIALRLRCNCPKLPARDPRSDVVRLRLLAAEKRALKEAAARESKSGDTILDPVSLALSVS